jgi:hypothetical protein
MHSEQYHGCDMFADAVKGEKGMMCKVEQMNPCASVSPRVGAYRLAYQQIGRLPSAIANVIGSSSASGSETRV